MECENCKGTGHVYEFIENIPTKEDCPDCGGTGKVETED